MAARKAHEGKPKRKAKNKPVEILPVKPISRNLSFDGDDDSFNQTMPAVTNTNILSSADKENQMDQKRSGSVKKFQNGKIRPKSKVNTEIGCEPLSQVQPDDTIYSSLQARLEALTNIRETEPERLLREYRHASEQQLSAGDALVKSTLESSAQQAEAYKALIEDLRADLRTREQEISVLNAKLATSRRSSGRHDGGSENSFDDASRSDIHTTSSASRSAPNTSQIVNVLSALSEVSLTLDTQLSYGAENPNTSVYRCLQSGPTTIFKYILELNEDEPDSLVYTPLDDDEDNALAFTLLPSYFQEPLTFKWTAVSFDSIMSKTDSIY